MDVKQNIELFQLIALLVCFLSVNGYSACSDIHKIQNVFPAMNYFL
jgi:hypothetical protein